MLDLTHHIRAVTLTSALIGVLGITGAGGEPGRLTWQPGADMALEWTFDGADILGSVLWTPSGGRIE